ncbi:MAG: hypothetical protein AB1750_01100 [Chloroflexota bacterium]
MNAKLIRQVVSLFLLATLLAACGKPTAIPTKSPPQPTSPPEIQPTEPPAPSDTPALTDAPAPTATPEPKFPPEPQRVEFQAEDGINLVGYYYPAAVDPAPALVLMHWAGGTHCDWIAVNLVQWAQNRGLPEGIAANPACANAELRIPDSLAEFPPLPEGQSYAIFAFDYRGYGESEDSANWDPSGYLKDSIAAVKTAQRLEGVDPNRVATIGASIGADGAIDACAEGCLGALSLSPGNYLGVDYAGAVKALGAEQKPAWCVASKQDGESYPKCQNASGDFFQKFIYEENGHGMSLFASSFDPKVTQIIFDFMRLVFGGSD